MEEDHRDLPAVFLVAVSMTRPQVGVVAVAEVVQGLVLVVVVLRAVVVAHFVPMAPELLPALQGTAVVVALVVETLVDLV
jgi:hypothetical protein